MPHFAKTILLYVVVIDDGVVCVCQAFVESFNYCSESVFSVCVFHLVLQCCADQLRCLSNPLCSSQIT